MSLDDQFASLTAEYWDAYLEENPGYASWIGDGRWSDCLESYSPSSIERRQQWRRRVLHRLGQITPEALSKTDRISHALLVRQVKEPIESERFREWETPLNQFFGLHLLVAQLPSVLTLQTPDDVAQYVCRLRGIPRLLEEVEGQMRQGIVSGNVASRLVMERVLSQLRQIGSARAERSPFARPLKAAPECRRAMDVIIAEVNPAFLQLAAFVETEYLPAARVEPGLWVTLDGEAYYEALLFRYTGLRLTASEVRELGQEQMRATEAQLRDVAAELGYRDIAAVRTASSTLAELRVQSKQHLIGAYRHYVDAMNSALPKLVGDFPQSPLAIEETESFREHGAASAQYVRGSMDGARPGRLLINTLRCEELRTFPIEAIAYHEGIPGHHLEAVVSQSLTNLPAFRRNFINAAYQEGWAFYAESLGKEAGMFREAWNEFGRLQEEMFRATRLVVDTGIHAFRWTQAEAEEFMRKHCLLEEFLIRSEIERYYAVPAQAVSYQIGRATILNLRENYRKRWGGAFDVRRFHQAVLANGCLPLDLLAHAVNDDLPV
jgi:uncharacterized protein (DUF885 family)